MPTPTRIRQRWSAVAETWRTGIILGVATAAIFWCVWYFTKIPCTPDNAASGLCNPGIFARFVNAEIMALAGGAGIAVATLKGGYDTYMLKNMLNEERAARLKAEEAHRQIQEMHRQEHARAEEARAQADEERRQERMRAEEARARAEEAMAKDSEAIREFIAELRNEMREERQQRAEERNQSIAVQQAMLDAIVRLAQGRNGNPGQSNGE